MTLELLCGNFPRRSNRNQRKTNRAERGANTKTPLRVLPTLAGASETKPNKNSASPSIIPEAGAESKEEIMNFHITLSPEQFEFLDGLLGDVVQLYEHQAAALACLDGEAARDLAQERLDASQNAAEIAWLLANTKPVEGA